MSETFAPTLRVATYNVHGCVGMDRQRSEARIAEVIAQLSVDIVGLQELDLSRRRSAGIDQTGMIAEQLGWHSHFYPAMRWDDEHYGNAILSRYPLTFRRAAKLPGVAPFFCRENRTAIGMDIIRAMNRFPKNFHIAVLPFENLSRDPDNTYFADAIQDEILTRLSKIADLKVISRTSTQHYQNKPRNLAQIAKQLGVANVVEGTVQKAADQVRVNVQLINAQTDSHLWADTYDRKLTDILVVESEIAKAIADKLRAKLTGQEEQVIATRPTNNPEAYDTYLRGLAYSVKPNSPANALAAQKYFREAVRLDPKFALAWALLSYTDASGYIAALQPTVALREEARQAAETASSLQPNLGEAVLAKGYYHYGCLKDYDTAVRYFQQAVSSYLTAAGFLSHSPMSHGGGASGDPRGVDLISDALPFR